MTSSKFADPRQVPPPPGTRQGNVTYGRFIPREELQGFAAWSPGAFGEPPRAATAEPAPPEPVPPTEEEREAELQAQLHDAHQAGYQDGYRDGLAALESFKQSFAQQTVAQVGQLMVAFDTQLDVLEQQMADTLRRVAAQLARQVVRSELATRPELVAQVAEEAVNAVLMSARHITLRVNPADHALVTGGAAEAIEARGARVLADATVERGGCVAVSDMGTIDAGIAARWDMAAAGLGSALGWHDAAEPGPGVDEVDSDDGEGTAP